MYSKYFVAWFPIVIIAFANAAVRRAGYAGYVGDLAAHQISTPDKLRLSGLRRHPASRMARFDHETAQSVSGHGAAARIG